MAPLAKKVPDPWTRRKGVHVEVVRQLPVFDTRFTKGPNSNVQYLALAVDVRCLWLESTILGDFSGYVANDGGQSRISRPPNPPTRGNPVRGSRNDVILAPQTKLQFPKVKYETLEIGEVFITN